MNQDIHSRSPIYKSAKPFITLKLIWSFVLATGGLLLLMVAINNRFLPELDLASSITLFAAASLVGLLVLFSVFILNTASGWITCLLFQNMNEDTRGRLSTGLAITAGVVVYTFFIYYVDAPTPVKITAAILLVVFSVVAVIYIIYYGKKNNFPQSNRPVGNYFLFIIATLIICGIFYLYHSIVFVELYRPRTKVDEISQWWVFAMWLIFQAICMGLIASSRTPAEILKHVVALGFAGVALLLILTNNTSFIAQSTAQLLGIGSLPNVSLVVTPQGCAVLSSLSKGALCAQSSESTTYVTEPVTILSRFGQQVLIEYTQQNSAPDNSENKVHEIILPSSEILGWQRPGKNTISKYTEHTE